MLRARLLHVIRVEAAISRRHQRVLAASSRGDADRIRHVPRRLLAAARRRIDGREVRLFSVLVEMLFTVEHLATARRLSSRDAHPLWAHDFSRAVASMPLLLGLHLDADALEVAQLLIVPEHGLVAVDLFFLLADGLLDIFLPLLINNRLK